jgi:hypothetical protein
MLQPNVEEKTVTSSSAIDLPYESRGLQPSELLQSSDELGVKKGKASSWAVILVLLIVSIFLGVLGSSFSGTKDLSSPRCEDTTIRGLPEQISVNLGVDPARTITFSWAVSLKCSSTKPRVQYSTEQCSVMTEKALYLDATGSSYSTLTNETNGNYPNYKSPMLYFAKVVGLRPNTVYFYRVGDEACGWSPIFSTATAPLPGTPGVRFAVVGDVGTTSNSVKTLQGILNSHKRSPYATMLLVGDLSYEDGNNSVWDDFGRMKEFLSASLTVEGVPGNHEWFSMRDYSFYSYLQRYKMPIAGLENDKSGVYYSMNIGLAHIIMLAGYCPLQNGRNLEKTTQPCLQSGSNQRIWLEKDLAGVNREITPWLIVLFHQPFVNSNTVHSIAAEGRSVQNVIEDLLYANKVDLVISGHIHAYERSCKLKNYTCDSNGPLYITVGGGGNREGLALPWVEPQPSWSVYRQASYGFGEFTAVNSTHLKWFWSQNVDLTPTKIDSIWVEKGKQVSGAGYPKTVIPQYRRLRASSENERENE